MPSETRNMGLLSIIAHEFPWFLQESFFELEFHLPNKFSQSVAAGKRTCDFIMFLQVHTCVHFSKELNEITREAVGTGWSRAE